MRFDFVKRIMLPGMLILCAILFVFSTIVSAQEEAHEAPEVPDNDIIRTYIEEPLKLPESKKDIKGIVVDMISGQPIPGATVSLLTQKMETGNDGRFIFKGVNDYHAIQMTARIMTDLDIVIGCSYFFVPTTYYPVSANKDDKADIQIINMLEHSGDVVLKITKYTEDNIDKYCSKCHEGSPCLIEEEYGRAADGKIKLKGVLVRQSELEAYIEGMKKKTMTVERYSKIRYVDNHPSSVDITETDSFNEERVVIPEDMILKEEKIMICDTCHTRHIPTEWEQFVVMDFKQRESICIKCHQ